MLTLETSVFQIFYGSNSTFINSFDKTTFSNERDIETSELGTSGDTFCNESVF